MEKNSKILLMFSGGRDSFLTACRLLDSENNYILKLVTYDNGCSWCSDNVKMVADRLINMYGKDRVEYLGVYNISAVIREFFPLYFNKKPSFILKEYGELPPSQVHCLMCRTSMYIYSIWLCKKMNISMIAEGGRKCQKFVIELPGMLKNRYPNLLNGEKSKKLGIDIQLITPVYDLVSDWKRDNELIGRGFLSKTYEPKCMIGYPAEDSVDDIVIKSIHNFFDKAMIPVIYRLLTEGNVNQFFPFDRSKTEIHD